MMARPVPAQPWMAFERKCNMPGKHFDNPTSRITPSTLHQICACIWGPAQVHVQANRLVHKCRESGYVGHCRYLPGTQQCQRGRYLHSEVKFPDLRAPLRISLEAVCVGECPFVPHQPKTLLKKSLKVICQPIYSWFGTLLIGASFSFASTNSSSLDISTDCSWKWERGQEMAPLGNPERNGKEVIEVG